VVCVCVGGGGRRSRCSEIEANISASKIVTIGDDIASMLVVSAPKGRSEGLREGLGAVAKELRLQLQVCPTPNQLRAEPPPSGSSVAWAGVSAPLPCGMPRGRRRGRRRRRRLCLWWRHRPRTLVHRAAPRMTGCRPGALVSQIHDVQLSPAPVVPKPVPRFKGRVKVPAAFTWAGPPATEFFKNRPILTEIYLRHARSCREILRLGSPGTEF
jgi:hypothetical protein